MGAGRDNFGDLRRCRFIVSVLQAGRIRAAPLHPLGRSRRRCRWRRCADSAERLGSCRAWPSSGLMLFTLCEPGPRTRFLSLLLSAFSRRFHAGTSKGIFFLKSSTAPAAACTMTFAVTAAVTCTMSPPSPRLPLRVSWQWRSDNPSKIHAPDRSAPAPATRAATAGSGHSR